MGKVWLMFWTRGGEELKTKNKIEKLIRDMNLGDKIEKVFVPTIRATKYIKKKRKPKFYDIIIESFPEDIPVEFSKMISKYPLGFKGKIKGGLGYEYENLGKNVYKINKLDRSKIREIFKTLVDNHLKPAIIGVHEGLVDEVEGKIRSLGFSTSRLLSAMKTTNYEEITEVRVVEKPMYKGYIFILMEEDQKVIDIITRNISNTRPMRATDSTTGQITYLRVENRDIEKMGKLIKKHEDEKNREFPFVKGDKVKIVDGVLKGREGVVEEVDIENNKLVVKIGNLFGKPQLMDVKFSQVERVEI